MSIIDLLIKDKQLSDFGLLVTDVTDSPPSVVLNLGDVPNRSRTIIKSKSYGHKSINVTGSFVTETLREYEDLKDRLNGMITSTEPYYITKLISNEELYEYENPGESSGDIDFLSTHHYSLPYRWYVYSPDGLNTSFEGKSTNNYLFTFNIQFQTVELPFGETIPKTVRLPSNRLLYEGTVENSQLEHPWRLVLEATEDQRGEFNLQINDRKLIYDSNRPIKKGDLFVFTGVEITQNGDNVTHYSNYEYFILNQGLNQIETDFLGDIRIENYVELYK